MGKNPYKSSINGGIYGRCSIATFDFSLISTFSSTWKCPTKARIGMMFEKLDDDCPMVQPKEYPAWE